MKKNLFIILLGLLCTIGVQAQSKLTLSSPNGELNVTIRVADKIYYDVSYGQDVLLKDNILQMKLGDGKVLGEKPALSSKKISKHSETTSPLIPLKFASVNNEYNQLLMKFKGNYSVEFRAFDDGIAYRFITDFKNDIIVEDEVFALNFPSDYKIHWQPTKNFKSAYESRYNHHQSSEWKPTWDMATLPVLIESNNGYKILFSEADLYDYPCMFWRGTEGPAVTATFPKVPTEFGDDGDRRVKILKEADYIAKTNGKRNFPWRFFVITKEDGQLIENTMVYKLSSKNEINDPSWIKPGRVSWEWWNGASVYGPDVNFVSGFNMDTYKYFIDFASKYGLEYIIMDEGWAKSTRDPFTPNDKIDLPELIRYGKSKNVDIVLWLTWLTVENNFGLFKTFADWGIKGVKIDFMDRSDQWMVDFYERVAKEAAANKLFVAFHGSFKPAGLEYRYPNVIAYEGVRGMEQMGGCTPDNSVYFPYMRNAVGPMDYTPGAMTSMQPELYLSKRPNSASIGTRAYQLALFVIFETGLQMLADSPTAYYNNPDCTDFISKVPVTWDETIALDAKVGEYTIVAKRKGNKWFIGGMTNNSEEERIFEISLDFLSNSKNYQMTSFTDGINAGRQAMDYRMNKSSVNKGDKITIKMARNGGFAAVIE